MPDVLSLQWAQDHLQAIAVSGTAAIATILTAWKFGGKALSFIKQTVEVVRGAIIVVKFAAQLDARLARIETSQNDRFSRIEKELLPNGGTSLRDAVDGLRRSQMFQDRSYEALLDMHEDPLFRSDRFGQCEWINKAYAKLTGKTLDDTRGNGWLTYVHPDDRAAVFAEWRASIDQNRNFEMEYRIVSPNGFIKVKAEAKVLRDPKGEIIGFIGSLCDGIA